MLLASRVKRRKRKKEIRRVPKASSAVE